LRPATEKRRKKKDARQWYDNRVCMVAHNREVI
jgi:hypothetical protein